MFFFVICFFYDWLIHYICIPLLILSNGIASLAQLVEQFIRNE